MLTNKPLFEVQNLAMQILYKTSFSVNNIVLKTYIDFALPIVKSLATLR